MFLRLIVQQMRHKWGVTALLFLAMTALVTLYVYLVNSAGFSNRSMELIMKNMGHNLLILPEAADPGDFFLCTDRQIPFPDDVTVLMAAREELASKYYASILQRREKVGEAQVVITGIAPVHRGDETAEKAHRVADVPAGQARLGAEAARALRAAPGGDIVLRGKTFRVERILPVQGDLDDSRAYIPLAECQELLGMPGKINAILSFLCLHGTTQEGMDRYQRERMSRLFPGYKAISKLHIAQGRSLARVTTSRYLYCLLILVTCITVIVISVTGLQEVAERRQETGILLAMGAGYPYIVSLYVFKMLGMAAAAALAGFLGGSLLAKALLAPVLAVNTRAMGLVWAQFPGVIGLTVLVAVAATALPMLKLVRTDPNLVLTEE
jgi:hypothetical protein